MQLFRKLIFHLFLWVLCAISPIVVFILIDYCFNSQYRTPLLVWFKHIPDFIQAQIVLIAIEGVAAACVVSASSRIGSKASFLIAASLVGACALFGSCAIYMRSL